MGSKDGSFSRVIVKLVKRCTGGDIRFCVKNTFLVYVDIVTTDNIYPW